jgi:hypothetical protein
MSIPSGISKNMQGSLREELNSADAVSGGFGVIGEIAVLTGRGAMTRGFLAPLGIGLRSGFPIPEALNSFMGLMPSGIGPFF